LEGGIGGNEQQDPRRHRRGERKRGFGSIAHIPALRTLPQLKIAAVCTARQETAEAAARHYGVSFAFSDPEQLARHPDVDLVTVSVKVPDHHRPVMAAIAAGKHVYCEWPLGRDSGKAGRMLAAAEERGVGHAVGLQGQMSPAINYVKDLVAGGYVGRVLTATMIGCAHALCFCLGEFRELTAFAVSQPDRIAVEATGEGVPKNVPDELVVNGIVGDGAVVSFPIRGGMARGTAFLFEIHGENGDLALTATTRDSMQRQELTVCGAQGGATKLAELPIPAKYRWVPEGTPTGFCYNVAQLGRNRPAGPRRPGRRSCVRQVLQIDRGTG
jgi:predicted dehydrogenase